MATPSRSGSGWSDNEKLGLYLQIISKTAPKIPWHELELPAGRTIKACQMVIDKDRRQLKQAGVSVQSPAPGNDDAENDDTPLKKKASPKKRKNEGGQGKATKAKKTKKAKEDEAVASDDEQVANEDDADHMGEDEHIKHEQQDEN